MKYFFSAFGRIVAVIVALGLPIWAQFSLSGTSEIQESLEQVQVLGSALMIGGASR